jgi:anti-repressor protein
MSQQHFIGLLKFIDMNELIKIYDRNGKKVVSAKDLHVFVDMLTRFDIWIMRMLEYGFIENVDYQCLYKNVPMPNGGEKQAILDYALTIDCAKEISMLQRNDKGKLARQYFIEMEKVALQTKSFELPKTFAEALQLAADQAKQIELQGTKIKELEPKAEVYEKIADSSNLISIGEAAKTLNIGLGRNRLFEKLRDLNILMGNNVPYQQYVDQGYFETKIKPITMGDITQDKITTFVTGKGMIWLTKKLS